MGAAALGTPGASCAKEYLLRLIKVDANAIVRHTVLPSGADVLTDFFVCPVSWCGSILAVRPDPCPSRDRARIRSHNIVRIYIP